jgi:hypothetical protein
VFGELTNSRHPNLLDLRGKEEEEICRFSGVYTDIYCQGEVNFFLFPAHASVGRLEHDGLDGVEHLVIYRSQLHSRATFLFRCSTTKIQLKFSTSSCHFSSTSWINIKRVDDISESKVYEEVESSMLAAVQTIAVPLWQRGHPRYQTKPKGLPARSNSLSRRIETGKKEENYEMRGISRKERKMAKICKRSGKVSPLAQASKRLVGRKS